jgi:peptide chain release factor 2
MGAPDVWSHPDHAQSLIEEQKSLRKITNPITTLAADLQDQAELLELADPVQDAAVLLEMAKDLSAIDERLEKIDTQTLFSGKDDLRNAIITIQAGAGGVDAMDWAQQLERMYCRYLEGEGFKISITDRLKGGDAGIHYAEIEVRGPYAYGTLRGERGVHRIQHVSAFDSNGKKQTSFAAVDVVPIHAEIAVELAEKDLEIETFCSGGPGGQNVNKVASAVRIRHLPTGLMAKCQNHRSQLQNRENAMEILASKLRQAQEDKKERRPKLEASFGHQIRTYVLEPYQLVKDHRTEYETSAAEKVLDGDLGGFVDAFLRS